MKATLFAAFAAGLLLVAPHSASATPAVQSGALAHGGTYFISVDSAAPVAAVDLWFRAPDDGYDGQTPGLARVAATAAAAAKLASGKTLAEMVTQAGGRLSIEVFPDVVEVGVVVPTSAARRVLASLTAAYFAPGIDDAALHAALTDATVLAVQQQYEADLLAHDLLFARMFASKPANEPPIPLSLTAISHVTLDETKRAMRGLAERSRVIAEGAGALAVAAALSGKAGPGPIVAIVSGGNIELTTFCELIGSVR